MPDGIDLSAGFIDTPSPRRAKSSRLDELIEFAKEHKLAVGSTTGGRHNKGSKHYSGNAIDIKGSGAFDDVTVNRLRQAAAERGLLLRDERVKPPKQKVWGGPHVHIEAADIDLRGGLDSQEIDLSAGFEDQGQNPPPNQTTQSIPRRTATRTAIKPSQATSAPIDKFSQVTAGVRGGRLRPVSIGELRQAEDWRGRESTVPAGTDLRVMKGEQPLDRLAYMREGDLQNRVPSEPYRDRVAREKKEIEWRQRNQPEIDRQTALFRQDIQKAKRRGGDANKWIAEFGTKSGAGLTEFAAGLIPADIVRIKAEAAARAAEEESADRNVVSKFVQDVSAGFVASAPELAAMSLGVPAMPAFAIGGGIRASGSGRPVAPAVAHGAATGTAFEIPVAGQGLSKALRRSGAVGAGTTGVELATGAEPGEAIKTGLTNAMIVGAPEAARLRRRTRPPERTEGAAQEMGALQPEGEGRISQEISPAPVVDVQTRSAKSLPREPQRFQHLQFGEVEALADQSGARPGRIKVAEVNNPEAIHYVKKADMRGRGNERMVPIKEPSAEEGKERLYPKVPDTPEFKQWFGSSKVVDEAGAPLRVYHGTNQSFDNFDMAIRDPKGREIEGAYFSPDRKVAEFFSGARGRPPHVIEAYLSLENPYVGKNPAQAMRDLGVSSESELTAALKRRGYDGVIFEEGFTWKGGTAKEIVAFNPTQVKSATYNTGSFSKSNPSISDSPIDQPSAASVREARQIPDRGVIARREPEVQNLQAGIIESPGVVVQRFGEPSVEAGKELAPPSRKVDRPAIAGEEPKRMNFTQFANSRGTPSDYDVLEHGRLGPSGRMSERSRKQEGERHLERSAANQKAHDEFEAAIRRGEIVDSETSTYRRVTKEKLEAGDKTAADKELQSQINNIDSQLRAIENLGRMSHKPNGQLKAAYQRTVDIYNERKAKLLAETERNKQPGVAVPRSEGAAQKGAGTGEIKPPAPVPIRRLQGERLVTGERSDISLSQFVRKRGGIVPGEMFAGELDRLRSPDTGTTGLINRRNKAGGDRLMTADYMMEAANEAGFRKADGQRFDNVGDFLYAVERDVAGQKTQALTGGEIDFEKEYRKHAEKQIADENERKAAERSADALATLLESGRGGELFDKIVANNATTAEHQEFRSLVRRRFIRNADIEDLISEAKAEGVSTTFEGESAQKPGRATAEQFGFVTQGLEQQSVQPKPETATRDRLRVQEQERQRAANPERAAALETLADLRSKGMTVDDYARQGSLLGEVPTPGTIKLLRELESGTKEPESTQPALIPPPLEILRRHRPGEAGFATLRAGRRASTPILAEVERATQAAEQKPSIRSRVSEVPARLQTAFTSQFTPLRRLEKTLYGSKKVPVVDMARRFEQVAGAVAKGEADYLDFKKAVVEPIKNQVDDFNSYLFLKRVHDRISKDPDRKRVGSWNIPKAETGLRELEAKVGRGRMKQFEELGQVYQNEMRKALRLQVESGRMSEDLYNRILSENDFYAPFKVLKYIETDQGIGGTGRQIATTQALSKKITGIDSTDFQLGNILQASAEQIVKSRILAEKNLKMIELDKLADIDPSGDLIKRVSADTRPSRGYEVVKFLKNGEPVYLQVERPVAQAVQGLNAAEAGLLAKTAMVAKKPFQAGATSANAAFQVVNLVFADLPRAALISRYGVRSPVDLVRFPLDWVYSAYSSLRGNFGKPNDLYADWLRSGAANSTIQRELTPESFKPPPLGMVGRRPVKTVIDTIPKFANAIEETSKILGLRRGVRIEQIARLPEAERKAAMEKIVTEVRNYSGSPDFARRGKYTGDLNLLFMFLNARIQGTAADFARLAGRTGAKDAGAAWARLGTAIGLPTTALMLINLGPSFREDYDKVPEWEKKNYWMIPRNSFFINEDSGEKTRDYWRIPKREITGMFANTIESGIVYAHDRDPEAVKRWSIDIAESVSPLNITGKTATERLESVVGNMNPLIKVPSEIATGRDMFRHRQIIPDYMKNAEPAEQYRLSTPRGYVATGRRLNVSPLMVEHVAEGATGGGLGQLSVRQAQPGRSALTQYPILRRFVRSGAIAEDAGIGERAAAAEREETTKQVVRRREAMRLLASWRGLSNSDVAGKLTTVRKSDPLLADKIADLKREQDKGFTSIDRQIAQLGIESGEREKFIRGELARMRTRAQQEAFIKDLREKGLLHGARPSRPERPTRQPRKRPTIIAPTINP